MRRKLQRESRREEEFYQYYDALRTLSSNDPIYCDLNDAAAVKAHKPRSSPDKALTAFCQLGALRLNARRAMTFFFDNNAGYVLAESTRTLSLEHDSVHDVGDELWLGHSLIPRDCSVCEYTVELPRMHVSTTSPSVNIINDLREDGRFFDRPFVVGKPNARFYAGVPITTSNGVNIGAYCVLDDSPRNGLDERSVAFLHDMAATVMSHLESIRAKAERKLATQMVDGLGAFVRSTSISESIDRWHMPNAGDGIRSSLPQTTLEQQTERNLPTRHRRHAPKRSSTEPVVTAEMQGWPTSILSHSEMAAPEKAPRVKPRRNNRHANSSRSRNTTSGIQTMFHRAAELLRKSLDIDAAMFLDASVGYDGGLVRQQIRKDSPQRSYPDDELNKDIPNMERRPSRTWQRPSTNPGTPCCAILGASRTDEDKADEIVHEGCDTTSFTQTHLMSLLEKYPKGKCWNFDESGDTVSTSDILDSEGQLAEDIDIRSVAQSQEAHNDGEKIQRLFAGIRSFAIVGMWDQEQSRWFAACAVWSYEPFRILSDEYEVNFMAAFGEVVMAEVHRLRLQMSTKSKVDFISSISHELRSPLHGILGSTECMREHDQNDTNKELIDQIDIFGRTLLDIIDHILDFSNINHYARKATLHEGHVHPAHPFSESDGRIVSLGGTVSLDSDVSLDVVTEEIIGATVYSYCCSKESNTILNRKVSIICNIDHSPETQWICNIATGSWKRLCINLVNNALKFTSTGYIQISLQARPAEDSLKAFEAVLKISDSGCGMSPEFLENHLFEAFVQEDGLKEGTGLGMSLVAKIVKAFGATIEVQSEVNVGTTVTVVVPINRAHHAITTGDSQVEPDLHSLPGLSIGLLHVDQTVLSTRIDGIGLYEEQLQQGRTLLSASIQATCRDLGLTNIRRLTLEDKKIPDVYMIVEADLEAFQDSRFESGCPESGHQGARSLPVHKAVIVLCDSVISKRRLVASPPQILRHTFVEYLSQPVGPVSLKKSIEACVRAIRDGKTPASHKETEALHNLTEQGSRRPVRPISPPTARPVPAIPRCKKATTSTARVDQICLLLVDDNEINLKLLIMYAQKRGYDMLTAPNGLQAVKCYKDAQSKFIQQQEDLRTNGMTEGATEKTLIILMDINMPVMNGYEATRHIRRFEQQMAIKPAFIIALTGLGNASAKNEAYNSGMDHFLTKPVSLKKLTETLKVIESSGKGQG